MNKKRDKRYLSKEEIIEIIDRIKNGDFYSDIAKDYNVTSEAISYQARKLGLNKVNKFKRKNKLNENYFNNIDNEHKAYWLGFIMADGGVCYTTKYYKETNSPNRLYFTLSLKDKSILERFCDDIDYDKSKIIDFIPKGTYSNNPMCKLYINSKKLCLNLKEFDIVPEKTGKEKFLNLSNELMPHFIRGFFDGDGSVWKHNNRIHVSFTGNKDFLEDLMNYLYKEKIIDNKYVISEYENKNVCDFKFAKTKSIKNFFDYIYKDSTIHLERKYNKFL